MPVQVKEHLTLQMVHQVKMSCKFTLNVGNVYQTFIAIYKAAEIVSSANFMTLFWGDNIPDPQDIKIRLHH